MTVRARLVISPAVIVLAALPGCRGCSEDRPYTPFGMASSSPDAEPSPAPSVSTQKSPDAGAVVEKAVFAGAGSKRWQLEGQELVAPAGFSFEQAVRGDFDDDGTPDTLAWILAEPGSDAARARGEAWLFPARGEAKKLASLPGFVPSGPHCKLVTALSRTGPHTATLDARAECQGALIARSPTRALVVLAPTSERPGALVLRVADPAPGETLELSAITADRDGDGKDDIEVHVAVGSPGSPPTTAAFVWLDRAAGPSRDTAEPRKTLERLAGLEALRAKNKKVAGEALRRVTSIRRLLAALCAESATARLFDVDGNALSCGSLKGVVDSLATAEIAAELGRGRVLEAFGALARDGWYLAKSSAPARKRHEKLLLDAVKPQAATVTLPEVRPLLTPAPRYSPLAFAADGALLVRTAEGLSRIPADGSAPAVVEADADLARSLDAVSDAGLRFLGVTYSCDRSETQLGVAGGAPVITHLLAPRPGACGRIPFDPLPATALVGFGGGKLSALVGGSLVGDEPGGAPAGSPRSPDGRWIVVPTAFGVLVSGPEQRLLELGPSVPTPLRLTDCVTANDGKRAACLADGRVVVARVE